MFYLAFSNNIDRLAEVFSKFIQLSHQIKMDGRAVAPLPPDAKRTIIVQRGKAQFLKAAIANHLGLCANCFLETNIRTFFEHAIKNILPKNELLLNTTTAFSAFYPQMRRLFDNEPLELAISKAHMKADNLLDNIEHAFTAELDHPDKITNPNRKKIVKDIINDYQFAQKAYAPRKLLLPQHVLHHYRDKILKEIPDFLFIFDPGPISAFEIEFLRTISQEKCIFVLAFNPHRGFWTDEHWKQLSKDNSSSFFSPIYRDIAAQIDKSWRACLEDNQDPAQFFDEFYSNKPQKTSLETGNQTFDDDINALDDLDPAETFLSQLKNHIISLDDHAFSYPHDDSIQTLLYDNINDEIHSTIDEIIRLSDNRDDFFFDDVSILIPANVAEQYVIPLCSALTDKKLPYNIHNLQQHPLNEVYAAFETFVQLLTSDSDRSHLINFAFHPCIASKNDLQDKDIFLKAIDSLGIYSGFFNHQYFDISDLSQKYYIKDDAFTWNQGLRRAAQIFIDANGDNNNAQNIEPATLDDGTLDIIFKHYHRIHAILSDIQCVQSSQLSFDNWRLLIFKLFDNWLNYRAPNRKQAILNIYRLMQNRWSEDLSENQRHPFSEIIPLLISCTHQMTIEEGDQFFGGIQIRSINESVIPSKYVFMLGQTVEAFPSSHHATDQLRPYTRAQNDAYAWIKWFLNTSDTLYLSAVVNAANKDNPESSLSPFMLKLYTCMHSTQSTSKPEEPPQPLFDALSKVRNIYHQTNQTWPTSLSSFDTDTRQVLLSTLDAGFKTSPAQESPSASLPAAHKQKLNWKALCDIFEQPSKTYRKYQLKIDDYIVDDSPQSLIAHTCEPIAPVASDYNSYSALDHIRLRLFATIRSINQSNPESLQKDFMQQYDNIIHEAAEIFKKSGDFPSDDYWHITQKNALFHASKFIAQTMKSTFEEQTIANLYPFLACYQLSLGSINPHTNRYQKWFDEKLHVDHHFKTQLYLSDYNHAQIALNGDLPLLVKLNNHKLCFISCKKWTQPKQIILYAIMSKLSASSADNNLRSLCSQWLSDNHFLCLKDESKAEKLEDSALAKLSNPDQILTSCLSVFFSGFHEIQEITPGNKKTSKKTSKSSNSTTEQTPLQPPKLKPTKLQKYIGEGNTTDTESTHYWKKLSFPLDEKTQLTQQELDIRNVVSLMLNPL